MLEPTFGVGRSLLAVLTSAYEEEALPDGETRTVMHFKPALAPVKVAVLPLVKKYDAAVVAISNDETGISEDPDVRFEIAKRIVERAEDYGIKREDVVVDPLVMPIGAIGQLPELR